MSPLKILIIFNSLLTVFASNFYFEFFVDFFQEKQIAITLNHCWTFDEIKFLTQKFSSEKFPKYLEFNSNFTNADFLFTINQNNFVVVDLSCPDAVKILREANKHNFYKSPYKWLLIMPNQSNPENISLHHDKYEEILNDFNIFVDSEVFCTEIYEEKILVWQYYKINENSTIEREKYGEWTKTSGVIIELKYLVTSFRRRNLRLTTIRIVSVIVDNATYNHLEDFRFPMIDILTKAQFGEMMGLIDYLNATYRIVHADQWGIINETTGQWGGLTGVIQRNEADISGTTMFFFKGRIDIGNFLKLGNPSRVAFLLRKPPLSIDYNIYSLPFSSTVWLSYSGIVILATILLIISSYFENPRNQEVEKVGFGNILLLMAAAVCQQGCDVVPTGIPGRILTLLIFTALMFLYVSYSANIVALLQSTSDSIKTMEDILHSRLRVGLHNISYNYHYFMNASEGVAKALYTEKIGPYGYYNLEEGVEKVRQGLFALHVEMGSAYYFIQKTFHEHEKCECVVVTGAFREEMGWLLGRKESPYTEMFKSGLIKIGEYGIEKRFLKRYYRKTTCFYSAPSFTSVGIMDFYPAILIFCYGIFIAILIFMLEHVHKNFAQKSTNRNVFTLSKGVDKVK